METIIEILFVAGIVALGCAGFKLVVWLIETLEWINEQRSDGLEPRIQAMRLGNRVEVLSGRIDRLNQEIEVLQTALKSTQPKKAKSK